MTHSFNRWMAFFFVLVALPFYWLLVDNRPGDPVAKPVTISQLRELANAIPGQAPTEISAEAVGWNTRLRGLTAAGSGIRPEKIFTLSHRLEIPNEGPILIGTGTNRQAARNRDYDRFDANAQARVNASVGKASQVILLDPGPEQSGGLDALADNDVDKAHRLTEKLRMGGGGKPFAVAPGVVVIPTMERLPGTRLVYVRLADKREFLFTGDLAPTLTNIKEMRAQSRWITDIYRPENRKETFSWLHTLALMHESAPDLMIVSGRRIPKDSGIKFNNSGKARD